MPSKRHKEENGGSRNKAHERTKVEELVYAARASAKRGLKEGKICAAAVSESDGGDGPARRPFARSFRRLPAVPGMAAVVILVPKFSQRAN